MRLLVGSAKFGIIYFDTTDCAPCQWMEDSLFSNPNIIEAIKKDFIAIKIQTARNDTVHYQGRAFTESYMRKLYLLPGYPMTMFLEGRRNQMIGGQAGRIQPEHMLQLMSYFTSNAYKAVDFDEYRDNLQKDKKRER